MSGFRSGGDNGAMCCIKAGSRPENGKKNTIVINNGTQRLPRSCVGEFPANISLVDGKDEEANNVSPGAQCHGKAKASE